MRTASFFYAILIIALLPALAGCNMPAASTGSETPDITQAYETVRARLTLAATSTVIATPTTAPSATTQPSPTSPFVSAQPTAIQNTPLPTQATKLCDQAAPGTPIDVTIPDDTRMTPGQNFTKTWRLVNTGTCTWTTDYSIALFSGEPMGAITGVQLRKSVAPGESMDISVDLVAPTTAATYQGNWKLRNASSQWFGIGPNGNSPFWVKIVVAGTPGTTTVTVTPTATTTPGTPYPGDEDPAAVVSGSNSLVPENEIDLDTNLVNSGGSDLLYEERNGQLMLSPMSSALITVFGNRTPSYNDCASSELASGRVRIQNLYAGMYLCYRTDRGLFGYMRMVSFDEGNTDTLGFQILTWSTP